MADPLTPSRYTPCVGTTRWTGVGRVSDRDSVTLPSPDPQAAAEYSQSDLILAHQKWDHERIEALSAFVAEARDLTPGTALWLAHEWRTVAPPQVVQLSSGRRVGALLAQTVGERTDTLRKMDDFLGGRDLYHLVRREVHLTLNLIREASYSEKTGRSLLASIGELCQVAGWVASDAGLHTAAERFYLGGLAAAHAARDQPLAGNLLSSLAYQVANVGDPREAVLLAVSAYHGARHHASGAVRALLAERIAWANARLGNVTETRRALDTADDAFEDVGSRDDPAWVYWLDRREIDVMAGRCHVELRQPTAAIELLTSAIGHYDDAYGREKALYLSWLAQAHIDNGDIEQAASAALAAWRLSATVTSARTTDRIQLLRRLLAAHHTTPAVREFLDESEAVGRSGQGNG